MQSKTERIFCMKVKEGSATTKDVDTEENVPPDVFLTSKQEVADELKMSTRQLSRWLAKYPFEGSGVAGKIMGRWRVNQGDVWRWFRFVQRQEARHPEARRMRPEEAPEIAGIRGR